jgi:thiopeptide-type bacteriocin biosynthesis protein
LAEINYLPQIRAKNIFAREHYYDYSIAINTCQTENNIELDDLYINFDGNRFNIFSKTLEKNVIPKITSAIDYSYCDNDLYKFLCDLQYQEGELYRVNFDFNNQQNIFTEYIPRIFLEENILLSPSQMLLTAGNYLNFDEFKFKLLLQLKSFNFSNTILIPDKKGYLVHGTSDEELIILYKLLLEKRYFFIKEHIYDSYQPIMQDSLNQSYCHEIISCVKNKNIREIVNNDIFLQHIDYDSNSPLISDWFFIELYCKKGSENEILTHYENNLNKCDLFFFVRYNYPKNHIRLRIKTSNIDIIKENIELSEFLKKEFAIIDYKICPYNQELTRYGGKSIMQITEYLFHTDTKDYLENFVFNKTESDPILYAINKVLCYFKKFNFTLNNMIEVCDINVLSFSNEFKFDQGIRKAFNKEYSEIKNKIFFNNNLLSNLEINNETLNEIDNLYKYISDVIHMGLNRSFESKQRFNEFKTYYFTKLYLNRIKFNK